MNSSMDGSSMDLFMEDYSAENECEDNDIRKELAPEFMLDEPSQTTMPPPPLPDASEKMRVFLRIRPLSKEEELKSENQGCVSVQSSTKVNMIAPKDSRAFENTALGSKTVDSFTFTHIYDEMTSQKILFEDCMLNTVKDFVDGQNCLCFAYGVTNSGKTYTMLGAPKEEGIVPRSLEVIFNTIGDKQYAAANIKPKFYSEAKRLSPEELAEANKFKAMIFSAASKMTGDSSYMYTSCDSLASQSSVGESLLDCDEDTFNQASAKVQEQENQRYSVWVSFAEIYNEQIHDLLQPLAKTLNIEKKRKVLNLREDRNGNPYIKDLKQVQVSSADEALKVLAFGKRNLNYACTPLNEKSSRSHCIFTIKMIRIVDELNPHTAHVNHLSFCDLAGSERCNRTGNTGERFKEANSINNSLLTLRRCMHLLRQNQQGKTSKEKIVPFRESKLTRLFQTYFSGKGKASMLVNISPAASSYDENIQTLKFSAIAQHVQSVAEKADPILKKKAGVSLLTENFDGRGTIQWATKDEIQQDAEMSMITEEEPDSPRYIEHMQVIDKLQKALIEADQLIKNERREKKQLESDLHKEFRKKIAAHTAKIEADHEHQMAEEKQRHEDYVEEKVNLISSAINKSAKRKLDKAEEEILKKEAQLKEYEADILKLKEQLKQIQGNSESCSDIKNSKDTQEEVTLLREQLEDAQKALIEKDKKLAEVMESKKTVMADLETIKSESFVGGEKLQSVSEEVILLRQNLDDLQKTLLEKEKELAEVNEIKCSLMDNLEAAKTLNTDFRSQISKLNEEKNKYTSTVKELELEVRAVSRGLQESDRSKEETEKGLAEMRKKKELAEFELLEKTCQLETAQSESEQLSQQIAHRTEEYDALVLEMDQLKETLHSLQNSNSTQELETKCDSLTDKMKKLQDQLRRRSVEWKGDLGTVQTQLMTSKRELERVKREKDKLNKDNSDHQVELVELRKKHAAESDELESIKEQLSQLETNYQEKEENLSTITSKAIQLESELAEEKSLKLELELEKQNLRDLLRTSENQASSLESTVYRLRKEISKLEKSDFHSKENQELKDELASLQVSLKESETRCQKFSALESKLNETNEKMKNQTLLHQSATSTIQKLTEENENLRVKVDSSILVDTLKKQVYELKENVSIKENKAASLQVILDARQSEWERKDGSLETLKQKVQEADEKNVQLQEHLDGARTELQRVNEKLASLSQETSSMSQKEEVIQQLKAAICEQESTAKIQDEVVRSKEEEIVKLNTDICEWQEKWQSLDSLEQKKRSLELKLSSVVEEKDGLLKSSSQMMEDMESLNQKSSNFEAQIAKLNQKISKLDEMITRKDKIILQLEQKLRQNESRMQDLMMEPHGGRQTRTQMAATKKVELLEKKLKEVEDAYEQVLKEKEEQLKESTLSSQKKLKRSANKSPIRVSDRFKEPKFCNDNELSASTLELDVTPKSSSKKNQEAVRSSSRLKASSQKGSTLKRLREIVENSTSPLSSPAKKILQVKITPLQTSSDSEEKVRSKRRRKLYKPDENTLTADSTPKDVPKKKSQASASNVHDIVCRNMKSRRF